MNTRGFSAYNLARGTLLNSKLTLADSGNQPLKLLDIVVSGMGMDPTAGLWLTPLHATPAVPRVFPFDLIYMDKEYRVLDTAEMGPGIEFPPFHAEVASALVLPSDTLRHTHTEPADRLIVCVSNKLEALLAAASMPAPDTTDSVPEPVVSGAFPAGKVKNPGVIELTPERPSVAARPAPATAFEQSILTAVAKVADTRSTLEPKPPAWQEATGPGPSIAIRDAVLDAPRQVQPAIIEHHVDPEDLFSNWVVTAPPSSQQGRTSPPEAPLAPKVDAPAQEPGPAAKQNGRKTSPSAKSATESPAQSRAASNGSMNSKVQSKSRTSTDSDQPLLPAKSTSSPARADEPVDARTGAPPTPPATTFTAVPYGMWQVSMPTAIASMAGAKSPEPAKPAPATSNGITAKQPVLQKAAEVAPAAIKPPDPSQNAKSESATASPVLKPKALTESPSRTAEQIVNPTKPVLKDATSNLHRPGDFVASLQEKLQRAQHSRPAPAALAESTLQPSPAPSKTAASVPVPAQGQKATAESSSVPAKVPVAKEAVLPTPSVDSIASKLKSRPLPAAPAKAAAPATGFRSRFKQWLHPNASPSDRRRASRRYVPGMVAHYFTGGAPKPKDVADISMSGMYLLTDERWMPGTMIQMTLQKPCAQGEKKQSINVLSRIVRRGSDGVAAEFVMPEALSHISHDIQPSQATDKFALARFL